MIYGRNKELNYLDGVAAEAKAVQDSIKAEYNVAMGIGVGGERYWEEPRWSNGGKQFNSTYKGADGKGFLSTKYTPPAGDEGYKPIASQAKGIQAGRWEKGFREIRHMGAYLMTMRIRG